MLEALTHHTPHNEGWHFLEAGRRLERGSNLAILLHTTLVSRSPGSEETLLIEAVLGVTDSLITYRRRYQAVVSKKVACATGSFRIAKKWPAVRARGIILATANFSA